jgi:hypothetical protein
MFYTYTNKSKSYRNNATKFKKRFVKAIRNKKKQSFEINSQHFGEALNRLSKHLHPFTSHKALHSERLK